MSLCLNPNCTQPQNSNDELFCQTCGSELLLSGQYRVLKLLRNQEGLHKTYEIVENKIPLILKVFSKHSPKAIRLFQQEVKALKNLNHPGIPDYESDFLYYHNHSSEPMYCLVMEKISGMDLEKYQLQRHNRPLDQKFALKWLQQIAQILHYIHSQHFAHYNIKPSNIILKPNGQLALINFSKACPFKADPEKQRQDEIFFTPGFTPPEQEKGFGLAKSDFYALGRTFVYLLTGKLPIDPEIYDFNSDELLWRNHCLTIVPELADFIDQLMMRSPNQRPDNTTIILQRLEELGLLLLSPRSVELMNANLVTSPSTNIDQPKVSSPFFPSIPMVNFQVNSQPNLELLKPPIKNSFSFETVTINIESSGFLGLKKEVKYDYQKNQAQSLIFDLGEDILLELVHIPGNQFLMGSSESDSGHYLREIPQHRVNLPTFWIGKYAITQAQWERIMGYNPSHFKGKNRPVERVSWGECMQFSQRLSQITQRDCQLPSEAQWEYACRGNTTTSFAFGDTIITDLVNYDGNYVYHNGLKGEYRRETVNVGSLPPNLFGLYEMHGNVWEWCLDTWHDNYHDAPDDGSAWIDYNVDKKILRGGAWNLNPQYCRSALRYWYVPSFRWDNIGLRIVLNE